MTEKPDVSYAPSQTADELGPLLEARNKALRELDVEYCRNAIGKPDASEHLLLMVLHKGRYECTVIEDSYRNESRAWLASHGYGRMGGTKLLPEGELPK